MQSRVESRTMGSRGQGCRDRILRKRRFQMVHRDYISSGTQLEAEVHTPWFKNKIRPIIQRHPHVQKHILSTSRLVEAGEAERDAHREVEKHQTWQQHS